MLKHEDYCTLFNDAINRNETVVFGCNCTVRYSGRAESFLDKGDRIIIIKSDNTLLIHQPSGNNPVNYMKPGTSHILVSDGRNLLLKSKNIAQKDFMDVIIDEVYFFRSYKLEDGQSIIVTGTEEDMANMLYENPHMIEEGFKPVSKEEQTKYGFIDVFGYDRDRILTVVECKRYTADLGAVTQLRRYVEKIMISKGVSKVRGILVAPKITINAEKMLTDLGFKFVSIRPPRYLEEFDKKQQRLDEF